MRGKDKDSEKKKKKRTHSTKRAQQGAVFIQKLI